MSVCLSACVSVCVPCTCNACRGIWTAVIDVCPNPLLIALWTTLAHSLCEENWAVKMTQMIASSEYQPRPKKFGSQRKSLVLWPIVSPRADGTPHTYHSQAHDRGHPDLWSHHSSKATRDLLTAATPDPLVLTLYTLAGEYQKDLLAALPLIVAKGLCKCNWGKLLWSRCQMHGENVLSCINLLPQLISWVGKTKLHHPLRWLDCDWCDVIYHADLPAHLD